MKYRFSFLLFCFSFAAFSQSTKLDSILNLLKRDKEDTNKVIHFGSLCNDYREIEKYDSAVLYGNAALDLAGKLNYKKGYAVAYSNLGLVCWNRGDYDRSLDYYFQALKIKQELKDSAGIAKTTGSIGIDFAYEGNYPKALEYYFKALEMEESLGNKSGIARNLGNIGIVYMDQRDYAKSLEYYFKALKIDEELGNQKSIANRLGNIGIIYLYEAENDENDSAKKNYLLDLSLSYSFRTLQIEDSIHYKKGVATDLGNIGNAYEDKENYPEALEYFFKAVKIKSEIGDKRGLAIWLGHIAEVFIRQKKYNDAFLYTYRSLAVADSIGAKDNVKDQYKMLCTLYENSTVMLPDSIGGKMLAPEQMRIRSIYYFKKYMNLRETLFSEENKKELVRKEMNYEFDKKESQEKTEQDKKDALAKEELNQKEKERNYFIAGFALVLLLAGFIFRSYRQKQKDNEIISHQKSLVEMKQKEILDSIYYARRIQSALLPKEKYIEKSLFHLKKRG